MTDAGHGVFGRRSFPGDIDRARVLVVVDDPKGIADATVKIKERALDLSTAWRTEWTADRKTPGLRFRPHWTGRQNRRRQVSAIPRDRSGALS